MGYHVVVKGQNSARGETLSLGHKGPATGRGQEAAQPAPGALLLQRWRRLERDAIVVSLIVIHVGASVLVALLTDWIGR